MSQDLPAQLTALERLARSRQAIAMELGVDGGSRERGRDDLGAEWGQGELDGQMRRGKPRGGWWPVFTSMASTWWRRHPLNAVAHMAKPVIESYAREEPAKLMGIAALAGVAVVIIKPWRLISAGALLAAALRPSEISAFAMTMLSSFNSTLQKDKEQRAAGGGAMR
jgi:hypothetical protein